jgi:hypothetical protein
MTTAKPGNTRQHGGHHPRFLAVVNLALLALGAVLMLTPQVPQPLPLLGRLLAVAVVLEWSALTLLEARKPLPQAARLFKPETRPR